MRAKDYRAKKIATTDHALRTYIYGWDDALHEAASLMTDLGKDDLAILVKGIGQAQVNEVTGKHLAFEDECSSTTTAEPEGVK